MGVPLYRTLPGTDSRVRYLQKLRKSGITACFGAAFYDCNDGEAGETYGGHIVTSNGSTLDQNGERPFNVGSVTKVITASLLIKLAETGELTLDDPVARFVPAYRHAATTIRHLMTHTSGLQWTTPWKWPRPEELDACRAAIYASELAELPELNAVYCTQGYLILMDVIESVTSGQRLEHFAREVLFEPLGMKHTTFIVTDWEPGSYSLPYDVQNLAPDSSLEGLAATGESGLYATPGDLIRFAAMLLEGGVYGGKTIFSEAAVQAMLSESTDGRFAKTAVFWSKGSRDRYGCFGDLLSPSAVGHPGFSGCMLMVDPGLGKAGVLVTNSQLLHADWTYYRRLWNLFAGLPAEGVRAEGAGHV
ncbi:serine hydrolase domain-containing protein [Paenibacillus silvisoli]|uniref:serine hydrolase domain-containing protein n=1 Tax=Paenibacillus silvisoli TaxID=3110539 RepID=UPI0028057172|nr:serine hydrolase domain-containing protein [Paenibacillus silvisoli]